jgi:ATP-dependent protease HslVU (ClpYQ) peptidase subunit
MVITLMKIKRMGQDFQFLISVGGELFDVDEDLSVMKNEDNMYAIGSGGSFALGALYAGAAPMQAMEIASKVSAYSAPPFYEEIQYK